MKTKLTLLIILVIAIAAGGCKKKKSEDNDPRPYALFAIEGKKVQYNDYSKFKRFCVMSHFCGDFMLNKDDAVNNYIGIGLPDHVEAGKVYKTGDHHFYLMYISPDGNYYRSGSGGHATVSIDLWEGNGGWVKGRFSGSLHNENDPLNDSIVLQDGYFQGMIYYVTK